MSQQIIVGFDAKRVVKNGTGLGSYGRTLVNDLAAYDHLQLRLYTPDEGREQLRCQVPLERSNVQLCLPGKESPGGLYKLWWRTKAIVPQLQRDGVQVFHGLSGELPLGIRQSGIKSVVTIHDLIFIRHPEYYNPIDVQIYKWKFRQTLREADRIVAISECTRRDICELGGVPEERIDLIYQSCASRFSANVAAGDCDRVSKKFNLPQRYILSVGSIEERKNALLTLRSLHRLPSDVSLLLVGKETKYTRQLLRVAKEENLLHRLVILHGVPDEDLPAIYALAEVFAYPSRYEGFGIPIIEAIRMGLPVVGATGSCLEEAGGPDNLYVNPDDTEGMAHSIGKLLKGAVDREVRIERSRDYIRRFENNDAARRFDELYRAMIH